MINLIHLSNTNQQLLVLEKLFIIYKNRIKDYLVNFLKLIGVLKALHQFQNPSEFVLRRTSLPFGF